MFWTIVIIAGVGYLIYRLVQKPASPLDVFAKETGIPKELLQMLGEEENQTQKLSSKSVPGATGPYGLCPTNPICCGNIMRMESTYALIHFNGKPVRESLAGSFYSIPEKGGIRSRVYNHSESSGIPTIYMTKEYHYPNCRREAPEAPEFSMGNA